MSKPALPEPLQTYERLLIEAMQRGLRRWTLPYGKALDYPESYSDLQACARGIMEDMDGPWTAPKPGRADHCGGKVVVHRKFPGDHAIGCDCWCMPGVFDPEDLEAIEQFSAQDRPS